MSPRSMHPKPLTCANTPKPPLACRSRYSIVRAGSRCFATSHGLYAASGNRLGQTSSGPCEVLSGHEHPPRSTAATAATAIWQLVAPDPGRDSQAVEAQGGHHSRLRRRPPQDWRSTRHRLTLRPSTMPRGAALKRKCHQHGVSATGRPVGLPERPSPRKSLRRVRAVRVLH